jgi:hypothetical protein
MPLVATSRMAGRMRSGHLFLVGGEAMFISASWPSDHTYARAALLTGGSRRASPRSWRTLQRQNQSALRLLVDSQN